MHSTRWCIGIAVAVAAALAAARGGGAFIAPGMAVSGHTRSADGVEIAYSERGSGPLAIVFIHGGLADRTFWAPQFAGLPGEYRLVALDLAGHGDSGSNRATWTIAAWAGDVVAVADALKLQRIVLVGNSLGGPVALEAAARLRGRAIGVIGVDTLHDATQRMPKEAAHQQAEALRKDYAAGCRAMVAALFHPGTQAEFRAWAERRMCSAPRPMAAAMMESFGGYDMAPAFRNAGVPIRGINGDLWTTRTDVNRTVTPDFDAVIMKGAGHYPMLERPAEFDRLLLEYVQAFDRVAPRR
ncbi:MAG TPA: alpha/beta hydrolase [Thermoanaerobaculaceae bacterium]|nr:alpha/beta hydrolase [Thermoanaerobaculaceae bacterium]